MRNDFEKEYLEILSSIPENDKECATSVKSNVREALKNAVQTCSIRTKEEALPKVIKTDGFDKDTNRMPLKRRDSLSEKSIQNDVPCDEEYLEAELPIIKENVGMSTYIVKEIEKTQVIKPITSYEVPVKKKKKFSFKKLASMFVVAGVLITAVYSATKVSLWNTENEASEVQMEEIKNLIVEKVVETDTSFLNEDSSYAVVGSATKLANTKKVDYAHLALVDVDFSKLAAVNADTVAYMKINGLDISAPIVQTTDNDFYLNHSYDKSYNTAGWIFGDYRDDWDNLKTNTIVYGHNRMNYAMFGSLKLVFDENWNKNVDNHFIHVSTASSNMVWQIFSAYIIPTETYYLTNSFDTESEYQEYLDTITSRTTVDFGTDVTTEDKILTLSTCYTDTSKTVVHAKLVKRQYK